MGRGLKGTPSASFDTTSELREPPMLNKVTSPCFYNVNLGPFQTSNFTSAEYNANEKKIYCFRSFALDSAHVKFDV